jgi:hypothetical protein
MSEIDDKNWIEEQFISLQAFHRTPGGRIRKITAGEQFKPRTLESFDPVTQESYRGSPATIHTLKNFAWRWTQIEQNENCRWPAVAAKSNEKWDSSGGTLLHVRRKIPAAAPDRWLSSEVNQEELKHWSGSCWPGAGESRHTSS